MRFLFVKGTAINLEKVSTIEMGQDKNGPFIIFAGQNLFKVFLLGEGMTKEEFDCLKGSIFAVIRK